MSVMYVYLLKSKNNSSKSYIGITNNLRNRLEYHNNGYCKHTSKFRPWEFVTVTWFKNHDKAFAFEKYLKHGSGHAFAKKHLWPPNQN